MLLGPWTLRGVSQRGLLLNSSVCFRAKRTDWLGIHGLCATKAIPDLPDNILVKNPEPESQHQLEQYYSDVVAKLSPRGLRGFRSICDQVGSTILLAIHTDLEDCSITHTALIVRHGQGQTGSRYAGIWASEGVPRLPLASSEQFRKLSHTYLSWSVGPSP